MQELFVEALNQGNGAWRIDSLGDLAYPNLSIRRTQPSFQVAISQVLVDPLDNQAMLSPIATNTGKQRLPWCSLGMLPFLRVGDIWKSGKLLSQPDYQLETFADLEINTDTTALIKAGLSQHDRKFLLPLSEHPWHRAHTQAYCLMVQLPGNRQIVIPCWELIRFYFGSSSRFLHTIFQYTLQKQMLYTDTRLSHNHRRLHITLAEDIPGRSAPDIGRIAMDNTAWRAALRVATSCLRASTQREPIFPNTFFPFEGKTTLVAAGKWLPLGDQENATFMVFNLRSCSHPFPFDSLEYECPGQRKPSISQPGGSESPSKPTIAQTSAQDAAVKLTDQDPGALSTSTVNIGSIVRFPDLEKKEVWRSAEVENREHGCTAIIKSDGGIEMHATGDSVPNAPIRAVEIVAGNGILGTQRKATLPGFLREALTTLRESKQVKIKLLYLDGSRSPVILVPKIVDEEGEIHPGCYFQKASGSHRPRKAAIILVINRGEGHSAIVLEGLKDGFAPQVVDICASENEVLSGNRDIYELLAQTVLR